MFEIGTSLREARLRQGLSLAQVEVQLRIRCRYLAALEEERFELLPGMAYARAFLRGYADFLGLDGELILTEYKARFEPAEELEEVRLPAERASRRLRVGPRLAAAAAILLLTAAGVLILGLAPGSHPRRSATPTPHPPAAATRARTPPAQVKPATPARPLLPVSLRGIGAWDPYGDRREHDSEAPAATDRGLSTYWETETYTAGLRKPGVGLLLDAGQPVRLRRLTLATDTPGYTALIQAGPTAGGPFRTFSPAITVATTTTFPLHAPAERYYLVWITRLDHVVHVNDVHAFR
jgi:transcriptional regulator with XRE-family HTH domain